jgi:hypothetical protein
MLRMCALAAILLITVSQHWSTSRDTPSIEDACRNAFLVTLSDFYFTNRRLQIRLEALP